jgi:peptidyl-prolyl cis-trans isomerase SurA
MLKLRPFFVLCSASLAIACSGSQDAPGALPAEPPIAAPTPTPSPAKVAPGLKVEPANPDDVKAAASQIEACGQTIVVAFKGALQAPDTVTRDKAHAIERAGQLLEQVKGGADFAELARKESDAPSSAARGGTMGTFYKQDWPALHEPLKEPLFALEVGALAPAPIEVDYGIAVLKRCPIEKAHSRHMLVRYKGAKKADGDIKRTKEQAKAFAEACLERLNKGEDFAKLALECSNDASKERGGDIGLVGRGLLAPAYEAALFGMKVGERSAVIETDFGFHVIERIGD